MSKLVIDFLLGATLLSLAWSGLAWLLVKFLRITAPGARVMVFAVPLIVSFAVRIRLLPEWRSEIVAFSVCVALGVVCLEAWRYVRFMRQTEAQTTPDAALQALVNELAIAFDMRPPRAAVSAAAGTSPFAAGFRKPVLVVPTALVALLDKEELRLLLAHELAHIQRKDVLWNWVLLFVRHLAFLNPAAYWPYRWLGLEMERACDSRAAAVTRKPGTLARTLLKVEEYLAQTRQARDSRMPLTVTGMASYLPQRIEMLAAHSGQRTGWSNRLKVLLSFTVYFLLCLQPGRIWMGLW